MNSLYKKIALVCLVSLTANQAAQAFQFSDILDWIKGNRTTSVAIAAGVAACVVLTLFKSKRNSVVAEDRQPMMPSGSTYTYTTFVGEELFNDRENRVRTSFKNVKKINTLEQTKKESLEKMMPGCTTQEWRYLCVATDEQNNIVSATLCKGEMLVRCKPACLCIAMYSGKASEVFRPIIETGQDITLEREFTAVSSYNDLEEAIGRADGDVKPERSMQQGQIFFDRDKAREKGCINQSLS